ENIDDLEKRLTEKRGAAQGVGKRVNRKMEAVEALRSERQRLEDQCKNEGWDDYDAKLRSDRIAIQDRQNEIASRAGQEGLSIPNFDASVAPAASAAEPSTTVDDLEMSVGDAIQVTEREIVSLDGNLNLITDLKAKLKRQQESLDILLVSKRALAKHGERYQGMNVVEQTERAREQQLSLQRPMQIA